MRQEWIKRIVQEYGKEGFRISGHEADKIMDLCKRKMEMAGIGDQEGYLPLLYEDELKNYLFRSQVNMLYLMDKAVNGTELEWPITAKCVPLKGKSGTGIA